MSLDLKQVLHTADLAKLDLALGRPDPQGEIAAMADELSKVVGYFDILNEVDTETVAPLFILFEDAPGPREDEPETYSNIDAIMDEAPEKSDGLFVVPKVL